ncbi:hypothetical protein CRE_08378 [Caenorhabditis remanei]|uniref:Uncharacterized protein n=1 Tax=Caenorhabditis remanei TaxID=31234 RepID=E3MPF2_CAERE|nr:hypothetical protein CRE_08378 [Caenorhabditis remanei]
MTIVLVNKEREFSADSENSPVDKISTKDDPGSYDLEKVLDCYRVEYQKHNDGSTLKFKRSDNRTIQVNNPKKELVHFLRHQSDILERFSLSDDLMESIHNCLKSRDALLKVEELTLEVNCSEHLNMVVKHLHPDYLQDIRIFNVAEEDIPKLWNLKDLSESTQWEKAKTLHIEGICVNIPILNLLHFSIVDVSVSVITTSDAIWLRNVRDFLQFIIVSKLVPFQTAIHSSKFHSFLIRFQYFENEKKISDSFGQWFCQTETLDGDRFVWWFSTKGSGHAVRVIFQQNRFFKFTRVKLKMAPDDILIIR